jgi:hypothetical protein
MSKEWPTGGEQSAAEEDINVVENRREIVRSMQERLKIRDAKEKEFIELLSQPGQAAEVLTNAGVELQGVQRDVEFLINQAIRTRLEPPASSSSPCLNPDFHRDANLVGRRPLQGRYNAPQEGG